MKNGYVITCPRCGAEIDDFSLCDEWFCECGESGELQHEEDEDD